MRKIFLYIACALMTVSVCSCSKDDPDLGGTQPGTETEEGGGGDNGNTINPIMTDFNDINQLYGTWTATDIKDGEEWYQLESPIIITFKNDGSFSYKGSDTSVTGTYTYSDSTAVCTRTDVLPVITGGYKYKFSPFDNKRVNIQMTVVTVGVIFIMDFLASKTAEE